MLKGQSAPVGSTEKSNLTKFNKYVKSLKFHKWEQYADSNLLFCNSNPKSKKNLTLREFYSFLLNGKNALQIINNGYNKHLVYFYSSLLRDKINLDFKTFEDEYLSGFSLEEISEKHKISRENITFLRELYGIKRKGATYINRKETEVPLNQQQKELIYGSLMGDGKKMSGSSFCVKHSVKQSDYVMWKYSILENIASKNSLKKSEYYDRRYDKINSSLIFYTHANTDVETILQQFYGDGIKKITSEILSNITVFGLAIWYMDDGMINWNFRSKKYGNQTQPSIYLCTESFTLEEHKLMIEWFKMKFNIISHISQCKKGTGQRLGFNIEETKKFINLVKPYIIASMEYKVNYNHYLEKRKSLGLDCKHLTDLQTRNCPVGDNFINLQEDKKQEWVDAMFYKLRRKPLCYSRVTHEVGNKFLTSLKKINTSSCVENNDIKFKIYPIYFIQHFHPHIYDMRNKGSLSANEIFNNDIMLKDIVRSTLMEGTKPTRSVIRRKTKTYRGSKGISNFPYIGAKTIIDTFSILNGTVVDFCAGFGSRLLGAWASNNCSNYIASEPFIKTYSGLQQMIKLINKIDNEHYKNLSIQNITAEHLLNQLNSNYADLIFTSPPYFDTEFYDESNSQSRIQYSNYNHWFNNWLLQCITESLRILKTNGNLVINIANCYPYMIANDLKDYLIKNEICFQEYRLFLSSQKCEPLFIIKKKLI